MKSKSQSVDSTADEQSEVLTLREKAYELVNLSRIKDVKVWQAYVDQRRPRIARMLVLFLISKIIHIIFLLSVLAQDLNEYLASDSVLAQAYP